MYSLVNSGKWFGGLCCWIAIRFIHIHSTSPHAKTIEFNCCTRIKSNWLEQIGPSLFCAWRWWNFTLYTSEFSSHSMMKNFSRIGSLFSIFSKCPTKNSINLNHLEPFWTSFFRSRVFQPPELPTHSELSRKSGQALTPRLASKRLVGIHWTQCGPIRPSRMSCHDVENLEIE